MPYAVEGQALISVLLGESSNGFELPIDAANLVELSLIQNSHLLMPSLVLRFYDELNVQEKTAAFSDGSTISVAISNAQSGTIGGYSPFNIHGKPATGTDPQGTLITIHGYLNNPEFMRKRIRGSFKGNTSDVISQLGQQVGIDVDALNTSDNMTWLPNGRSIGEYCRHLAERGWKDANSCLMLAMVESGDANSNFPWKIKYLDIVDEFKNGQPKATFINGTVGGATASNTNTSTSNKLIVVLDYKSRTESGLNNMMFGYGRRTGYQKLDGSLEQYEQVNATRISKYLDINKDIKTLLNGSVVREYSPIDSGNTHDNYHRANHQNRMMQSTYSNTLQVLVSAFTGLTIFDIVTVQFYSTNSGEVDQSRSGTYMVRAKTQSAMGAFYREKLELVSQGPDVDTGGFLV